MYPCDPFKCLFSDAQYHRTVEFSLKVESYQMATKNVSFHYYLIHITSNCANNTHFHEKIYYLAFNLHVCGQNGIIFYRNYPPKRPSYMRLVVWRHLSKQNYCFRTSLHTYWYKNVMRSHQGYAGDFYFWSTVILYGLMYNGGYVHVLFKLFLLLAVPYVNSVGRAIKKFNLIEVAD